MADDTQDQPKRRTTYDIALEQLTVEYPPVEVGTIQVLGGQKFSFNGKEWVT